MIIFCIRNEANVRSNKSSKRLNSKKKKLKLKSSLDLSLIATNELYDLSAIIGIYIGCLNGRYRRQASDFAVAIATDANFHSILCSRRFSIFFYKHLYFDRDIVIGDERRTSARIFSNKKVGPKKF